MDDVVGGKLFPGVPDKPSSYINQVLKDFMDCVDLSVSAYRSHSLRIGSTSHSANHPSVQIHWVAERGGWLLDSLNRVFLYITRTSQNEDRVGRSLSDWTEIENCGIAPQLPSFVDDQVCALLFRQNLPKLGKSLSRMLAAVLIIYYTDCDHGPLREKLDSIAVQLNFNFEELSEVIKQDFISKNILGFPASSPFLSGIQDQISVPWRTMHQHLDQSLKTQIKVLQMVSSLNQKISQQSLIIQQLQTQMHQLMTQPAHLSQSLLEAHSQPSVIDLPAEVQENSSTTPECTVDSVATEEEKEFKIPTSLRNVTLGKLFFYYHKFQWHDHITEIKDANKQVW